jgi:hypothetical protein
MEINMRKVALLALVCCGAAAANAQFAYTNGVFNGTNGIRPSANWDPIGIVNDFTLTAGNTTFQKIRLEWIDGTTPVGTISSVQSVRVRMYDLTGRTISQMVHDTEVAIYDQTFTKGGGTFVDTLSGNTAFSRDVEFWDLMGPITNLGAGHRAIFVTLPGSGPIDSFWGTSTPLVAGDPDAVFGSNLNSQNGAGNNEHSFHLYQPVPEPGTMIALGLGAVALIRRRRSAK